ncbi:MAG: GNAT family N-acetyltransferase, partial [Ilumatobacteraceae bacterium]
MAIEIRQLTEDRIGEAFWAFATALVVPPSSPERLERRRPGWFAERSLVAHDGPAIVGHVGSLPFQTLVPGGAMVPTAGLTRVGVLGTHRRRGLLTAMMHQSLVQSRERGEILGSLRAAEAAIYGRFGYGLAGLATQVKVRTERSAFAVPVPMAGAMRILQGPELVEHAQRAHARCIRRPGMIDRPEWYWPAVYDAHRDPSPSITEWGVVHYDEAGEPDGFAHWEKIARDDWDGGEASVLVTDLFGIDDQVEATIARFLLDLDLVDEVRLDNRPTDDPIRHR